MTMKGETVSTGADHPGTKLEVLRSNAGYYIGFLDEEGMPYSRESHYFDERDAAEYVLKIVEPFYEEIAKGNSPQKPSTSIR